MDYRQAARSIEYEELALESVPTFSIEPTPRWKHLFTASVVAVCGWAVIETPLELGGSFDSTRLLALVASKVLMGIIGAAAIANTRFAPQVFAFLCAAGVFAIAPALPLEYARCLPLALFSTVECLCKGACVTSVVIASLGRGHVRGHRGWRRYTDADLK